MAVADDWSRAGWDVRLLLGPNAVEPTERGVRVERFQSTADLEGGLVDHLPWCDVLVMAAAVSDYRPVIDEADLETKHRRNDGLEIDLEATPDLLAGCSKRRRPGQLLVGFALEPRERMRSSATRKLHKKGIDLIVANPLETMDGDSIEATLLAPEGDSESSEVASTGGPIGKPVFAGWLREQLTPILEEMRSSARAR